MAENSETKNLKIRKTIFISVWLMTILYCIGNVFWYNEWVYSLPTPVPLNYKSVNKGDDINIETRLNVNKDKPVFLHFFNPECPCSRFNVNHVQSLINKYSGKIQFAVVVLSSKKYTADQIQEKFGTTIPISFDSTIAIDCGVYSTPQAVIIDNSRHLYYRGNYNKSRYCTDNNSNFAQIALDSLLNNSAPPKLTDLAWKAYGCSLPNCRK